MGVDIGSRRYNPRGGTGAIGKGGILANSKELDKDIKKVIKTLNKMMDGFTPAKRKQMLAKAAKPLIKAAKAKAPKYDKKTGQTARDRRRKTGPRIVEGRTYYPGNLKRSIDVLKHIKSNDIFVGPRARGKFAKHQVLKGRSAVDAWYAHFIEYGTINIVPHKFMRSAYLDTQTQVLNLLKSQVKHKILEYQRKFALKRAA